MTAAPLISVITPTHNRAELLPRAIECVLAQGYERWELIIVDDGSTDATAEVVKRFEDPRIRYVYQENRQLAGARNRGMDEVAGELFCFLDDDDLCLPDHLQLLADAWVRTEGKVPVIRTGLILRTPDGDRRTPNWSNDDDPLVALWRKPNGVFCHAFATFPVGRRRFREDLLLVEDMVWLVGVLAEYDCYQIDAYTVVVHQHPAQRSATYLNDDLLQKNLSELAKSYYDPVVAARVPMELYQSAVFHQYMHYSRQLARAGEARAAARVMKTGMSYARLKDAREIAATTAKILFG